MTYAVTWTVDALVELGRVVAAHGDPKAVDVAAQWVDYTLRRAPLDMGESRRGNERLWYGDVLGVWYRVDYPAGTVRIMSVGPARRR